MKEEIIYTEHYALILGDEQAKENDWGYIQFQGGDVKLVGKYFADDWKKIIAHRPLTDAPILEGVPILPEFSQEDDIKLIAKQEAEKLHDKSRHEDWDIYEELVSEDAWLIEKGYNKAKETYKYTEEDLKNAFYNGWLYRGEKEYEYLKALKEFTQSLQQPKRPKYFECEMSPMNLDEIRENGKGFLHTNTNKMVVITNSQGQTELVGKYTF
jgi:hypothetical protein